MPVEFLTPVGRIVWGNPTQHEVKKNDAGETILKDGQPVHKWSFGLAISKAEFEQFVYPYLHQEALTVFPNGVIPPTFAWKYKDGDTAVTSKGVAFNTLEGRAGCYILTISTEGYAPQVVKAEGNGWRQMNTNEVNTGDYVRVQIIAKYNGQVSPRNPGLYINPDSIEHIGYGQVISSGGGGDPAVLFAAPVAALPAGASATPVAPVASVAAPVAATPAPLAAPALAVPAAAPAMAVPAAAPAMAVPAAAPAMAVPAAAPAMAVPAAAPLAAPATDFVANAGHTPLAAAPIPGQPVGR